MLNGVCNTPYLEELPEGDPAWAHLDGDTSLFYEQEKPRLEFKSEPYFEEDYGQLINDEQLLDLAKTAEETGNLLPLIKEELKCKIQAKRLAAGQEELNIQEPKPKANQVSFATLWQVVNFLNVMFWWPVIVYSSQQIPAVRNAYVIHTYILGSLLFLLTYSNAVHLTNCWK